MESQRQHQQGQRADNGPEVSAPERTVAMGALVRPPGGGAEAEHGATAIAVVNAGVAARPLAARVVVPPLAAANDTGTLVTPPPELPRILMPAELAALLRLRPRSVYQALARGEIPGARRIGRKIRVDRDTVLKWLADGQGRVSRSARR